MAPLPSYPAGTNNYREQLSGVLKSGGRVPCSRLRSKSATVARHVPETWLLPTHDPTDVVAAGLRPAQVPGQRPPGRAVRSVSVVAGRLCARTASATRTNSKIFVENVQQVSS